MNEILTALLRKEGVMLLVILNGFVLDRTFLRRWNTAHVLGSNPLALAIAVGLGLLAFALA